MTSTQEALARRAVAALGWKWMAGMVTREGHRIVAVGDEGTAWTLDVAADPGFTMGRVPADALPDFDDPATRGCLLDLVRDVLDCSTLHVEYLDDSEEWEAVGPKRRIPGEYARWVWRGATEAEALVVVIESVRRKP